MTTRLVLCPVTGLAQAKAQGRNRTNHKAPGVPSQHCAVSFKHSRENRDKGFPSSSLTLEIPLRFSQEPCVCLCHPRHWSEFLNDHKQEKGKQVQKDVWPAGGWGREVGVGAGVC